MTTTDTQSILHRKMSVGRGETPTGVRSILRALRLALARSAADTMDLAVSVIGATQSRATYDALGKHLDDDHLLILLDGPDGATGAVGLDRQALAALIQHQTMGQVTGLAPADRPFTGTDAAMAALLIDATLKRAADLADLPVDQACLAGFCFGARAGDARSVILALEGDAFRVFDLTLDFAGGVAQGVLRLILPDMPAKPAGIDADDPASRGDMKLAVGAVRAELSAVICRVKVPLSELTDLVPGDTLPLTGEHLAQTELVSIVGDTVATGRLGQIGGARAIRVNETYPLVQTQMAISDDSFAETVRPQTASVAAEVSVDGAPAPHVESPAPIAGLPAVVEDDADTRFLALSPEEAAAEISELAGLSLSDNDPQDQTDTADRP